MPEEDPSKQSLGKLFSYRKIVQEFFGARKVAVENNKEIDLHCGDGWRWDRCGRVRRPMCFRAYWNNSGKQRESSWGERTSMKEEGKSFGERRKRTLAFGMPYKISNFKVNC